jgi:type VI secretion system protein ImpL
VGGKQPGFRFALRPVSLNAGTTQVTFDFGGFSEAWTPLVTSAKAFDWPGPTGMADVRVTFAPPGTGADLVTLGPWALFRLLNQAKLEPVGGGESFNLTLKQGEREARFNLSAGNGHSPFDFELFTGFRCPGLR